MLCCALASCDNGTSSSALSSADSSSTVSYSSDPIGDLINVDDVYIVIYSSDLTNISFISVDPDDRSVNYDLTSKATVNDFRFLLEKG